MEEPKSHNRNNGNDIMNRVNQTFEKMAQDVKDIIKINNQRRKT